MSENDPWKRLEQAAAGSLKDPAVQNRIQEVILDPATPPPVRQAAFGMLPSSDEDPANLPALDQCIDGGVTFS